jgi:hypothetical protein
MIRHVVLLDASALCEDDCYMRDTLLSMGYGLYPMCVQFNEATRSLVFRRGILASEKDKAQRLSLAADELHALPAVQWYQEQQQQRQGGVPVAENIHIHGPSIGVSWSLASHTAAVHRRVIPDLLVWTRWSQNEAWARLQERVPSVAITTPRHVRFAQAIEWVVAQRRANKQTAPPTHKALLALAQHTLRRLQANELKVIVDPVDGTTIIGVGEQQPDA